MVNFKNGKIYKIINNETDDVYIGSTCLTLSVRFCCHKCSHIKRLCDLHRLMDKIGFDKFRIILVEDYPCDFRADLLKREQHYIDTIKPTLNKFRAYLSDDVRRNYHKNYYMERQEHYKIHNKNYYEMHKNLKDKEKMKDVCDKDEKKNKLI